ncbi:helix-turn-helix transcriptional regulator [Rhodoferax sp.]|uniref:helix-turn-helix domain-containing protein n=1 Tax=Rhodoferax sp. TaxID=50421 RepID=UPI002ACE5AB9|nr:helix-turn-helix transcriptional regulator [Rhodoferax sp.]
MSQQEIFLKIGSRIRELRADMTQDAFAQKLGVARKTVTRWEAGAVVPDGASLLVLLLEFGADPKWLLTGQRDRADLLKLSNREIALLDNYENADADGKKIIEGTALLAAKPKDVKGRKAA